MHTHTHTSLSSLWYSLVTFLMNAEEQAYNICHWTHKKGFGETHNPIFHFWTIQSILLLMVRMNILLVFLKVSCIVGHRRKITVRQKFNTLVNYIQFWLFWLKTNKGSIEFFFFFSLFDPNGFSFPLLDIKTLKTQKYYSVNCFFQQLLWYPGALEAFGFLSRQEQLTLNQSLSVQSQNLYIMYQGSKEESFFNDIIF